MPIDFRVLLASADEDVLDVLARRLKALGCMPFAATRPHHALSAAVVRHFHLALVTPVLDGGCGLELAGQLIDRLPAMTTLIVARCPVELHQATVARAAPTRCVLCPKDKAAIDDFLEDAIESACAAPRSIHQMATVRG